MLTWTNKDNLIIHSDSCISEKINNNTRYLKSSHKTCIRHSVKISPASAQQLYKSRLLLFKLCAPTSSTHSKTNKVFPNKINSTCSFGKQNVNTNCWTLFLHYQHIFQSMPISDPLENYTAPWWHNTSDKYIFVDMFKHTHLNHTDSFSFQPTNYKTNIHKLYGHMGRIRFSSSGKDYCEVTLIYFTKKCC